MYHLVEEKGQKHERLQDFSNPIHIKDCRDAGQGGVARAAPVVAKQPFTFQQKWFWGPAPVCREQREGPEGVASWGGPNAATTTEDGRLLSGLP